MSKAGAQIRKGLIFVHRWMGVGLCTLFLLWFSSGIVLMYCDYPSVMAADKLNREAALDPARMQLSPEEAYARLQTDRTPSQVRLMTFGGRPAYRFRFDRTEPNVYADTGEMQSEFPREFCLRAAATWTGQSPDNARVEANTWEDQWTVPGDFRALRPMWKFSWPDGEQVYVSQVTGDVVQYTTRASRLGACFGAIPHWLYFTPLRAHVGLWSKLVIWVSGLGTVAAIIGIVVGVWVYSPAKRYRHAGLASSIPYSGQKRWHMILGLIFGVLACTWAFSGMLSMDPFPQWQGGKDETGAIISNALRGDPIQMAAFATKSPREVLAEVGSDFRVKELSFASFAGEPVYLATAAPNQTRIIPVHGEPVAEFDRERIVNVVRESVRPLTLAEVRVVPQYEAYYVDRHNRLPLPVLLVRLNDAHNSMYYIDLKTAVIVQSYNSRSRWNRWLYHGLHSIDLPWLYKHRPAWDILILALMAGGTALSVTAIILAWRVVRQKLGLVPEDYTA
jgi:hypothetical protein